MFMRATFIVSVFLLCSCASGYGEFYKSNAGATPEQIAKLRVGPPPKIPALEHASRPDDAIAAYVRHGYALIGYSSFNSGRGQSDDAALSQGAKVGADLVVVVDPKYTGSISSSIPITTPTTTTSYSTGTATAYGPGGPVTAYGDATTTTYGNQTTYVPMTVHRYDYGALYFIKRHYVFGASLRDLNDDERRALQSNAGVSVVVVVDGSPAFRSDVLAGDIIVATDGQPVYGHQAFSDFLAQKRGQTVAFTIVRGGQRLSKSIQLAD